MFPASDTSVQRSQQLSNQYINELATTKMDITLDDIRGFVRQSYREAATVNQTTYLSNRELPVPPPEQQAAESAAAAPGEAILAELHAEENKAVP